MTAIIAGTGAGACDKSRRGFVMYLQGALLPQCHERRIGIQHDKRYEGYVDKFSQPMGSNYILTVIVGV